MAVQMAELSLFIGEMVFSGAKFVFLNMRDCCRQLRKGVVISGKWLSIFIRILSIVIITVLILLTLFILITPITFFSLIKREEYIFSDILALYNETLTNVSGRSAPANCSQHFFISDEDNLCHPLCKGWTYYTEVSPDVLIVTGGITAGMGLIVSIVTLIIAGFRYKIVFNFPTIFIIYIAISYSARDLMFVITSLDNSNLFCHNHDLIASILNPTPFCTISGVINQYTSVLITFWWLCLISVTLFKLVLPFHARSLQIQGHFKYVHITLVTIGLVMPLPGIIVVLTDKGYTMDNIPATVCVARNSDIQFFLTTLVNVIFTSAYTIQLIFITWIIHTHERNRILNNSIILHSKFKSIEWKLAFIFFLNLFLGTVTFISSAVYSAKIDRLYDAISLYLLCEAPGNGSDCSENIIAALTDEYLVIGFQVATAFLPLGPLFFVINWNTVKKFIKGKLSNHHSATDQPSASFTPSYAKSKTSLYPL